MAKTMLDIFDEFLLGDMVYDPRKDYVYNHNKAEPLTHTNPTFYPGASGWNACNRYPGEPGVYQWVAE